MVFSRVRFPAAHKAGGAIRRAAADKGERSMSAFEVSKTHIDVLVSAAMRFGTGSGWMYSSLGGETTPINLETADKFGQMLWDENARSVSYLHGGDVEEVEAYTFKRVDTTSIVQVLKAIDCLEYQSCEHDGWNDSEAQQFCHALRRRMIRALPGYDSAKWAIGD
jgi:hypothetical protein